jgi:hypothetical protein
MEKRGTKTAKRALVNTCLLPGDVPFRSKNKNLISNCE